MAVGGGYAQVAVKKNISGQIDTPAIHRSNNIFREFRGPNVIPKMPCSQLPVSDWSIGRGSTVASQPATPVGWGMFGRGKLRVALLRRRVAGCSNCLI